MVVHRSRGIEPVCAPAPVRCGRTRTRGFRSEMELRFTELVQPSSYATAATGHELLLAQTDVEAKLDRPVDVKGTPFPVRTLKSLLSLDLHGRPAVRVSSTTTTSSSTASIPRATWPVEPRASHLAGDSQRAVHHHAGQQPAAVRRARATRRTVAKRRRCCSAWACTACCRRCPIPMPPMSRWLRRQTGRRSGAMRRPGDAAGQRRRLGESRETRTTRTRCRRAFTFAPLGHAAADDRAVDGGGRRQRRVDRGRRSHADAARRPAAPVIAARSPCSVPAVEPERLGSAVRGVRERAVRPARRVHQRRPDGRELRLVQRARASRQRPDLLPGLSAAWRADAAAGISAAGPAISICPRRAVTCAPSRCRRSAGSRCST